MIRPVRQRQMARRLLSLLEQERKQLVSGNFTGLSEIAAAIEEVAVALEKASEGADRAISRQLEQIGRAARHNRALAQAGQRGLSAAMRLHKEAQGARRTLQTYTGSGQTRLISSDPSSSDRRA